MAKQKRKLTAWQKHVKSYMASHKGLSFKEALPKAKLTYRKGSNPSPRPSEKKARKVKRKMAKKNKTRRSRQMTIPLAPIVGLVPMVAPSVDALIKGDLTLAARELAWNTLGVDTGGKFQAVKCLQNFTPLIAGLLVHKFIGGPPLNLNRTLAAAKVPFIRI